MKPNWKKIFETKVLQSKIQLVWSNPLKNQHASLKWQKWQNLLKLWLTRTKANLWAELLPRNQQSATNPSFMKGHPARKRIKATTSSASLRSTRWRPGPRMPTGSRGMGRAAPTLIQARATNLLKKIRDIFQIFSK